MHGNDIDTLDGEEYGDIMEPKKESTLRLMLHNVNCLSANSQDTKSRKLIQTIAHKQIDVAMLTEIGLYWPLVPTKDKWYERTRLSFQSSRSILACNSTEPDRTRINQYGGVAVIAVDDVSHRVVGQGQDSTGLGRWAWMLFEGKQGHKLRVISVYRPVESIGPSTVFTQHERFFYTKNQDVNPRQAIYSDLAKEINNWKAEGNHIIVGIDANEDVRTGDTNKVFQSLGMRDAIIHRFQPRSPPATCAKNKSRQPIDAIFVTPGIRLTAGGYAPFDTGCPSDHRYLWVDVSYIDAFGYSSPPLIPPAVRRLKTKDPKMVKRYNDKVSLRLNTEGLAEALFRVEFQAKTDGWSQELEDEYNRINDRQYEIRKKVEAKL